MTSSSALEILIGTLPTNLLETIAPFCDSGAYFPVPQLLDALRPYERLPAPVAMRIGSSVDLALHEGIAHVIALAHNELAYREGWENYPHGYCTRASTGVMLSLIAHGYPNALVLSAMRPREHSYVGLPYVLGEKTGVILIDPTVGQMENCTESVLVERKSGVLWEYRPGWDDGADMYPDGATDHERLRVHANSVRTTAIDVKVNPLSLVKTPYHDAPSYLNAAFANPVDISSPTRLGEILKNIITG